MMMMGVGQSSPPTLLPVVSGAHQRLHEALSKREMEAAEMLAKGMSYRQIADAWFVELTTVSNTACNACRKVGIKPASHSMLATWWWESVEIPRIRKADRDAWIGTIEQIQLKLARGAL